MPTPRRSCLLISLFVVFGGISVCEVSAAEPLAVVGINEPVGCLELPNRRKRLIIDKSGTYENELIDGEWFEGNLVKIRADNVILKNCEIRNVRGNGIFVSGKNVTIESCKIHHCLAGSFVKQDDAHGITGSPQGLSIRNCEIYYVSGDAVQFDPDRNVWNDVTIENCTFWTGPLPTDAAGFQAGDRPGENAVDTKNSDNHPRAHMEVVNSLFYGWGNGQIENQAALNLKERVNVEVTNCVFRDNDICFRLRGSRKNTLVSVKSCAIYRSKIAFRLEDNIRDVVIDGLAIGEDVGQVMVTVNMERGNVTNENQTYAPSYERALRLGLQPSPEQEPQQPAELPDAAQPPRPFQLRTYLPGGSWRTILAVAIVMVMPVLGVAIYIIATGRRRVFRQVLGEAFQRMFSR